jgi:NTE family protein
MNIGLALSGGGFRATGFHLGVLARLAEQKRLEDVAFLSTVSGGSLCIGLVYALNDFKWPTSQEFIDGVQPRARELMISRDLQFRMILRILMFPLRIFWSRAKDLSYLLRKHWGVTVNLCDLPERPRWMINATCYETAKNWRFERFRMGDYLFGYTYDTDILLSDALAASAGFPGLIGPLILDTRPYSWFKYKRRKLGPTNQMDPDDHVNRKTEPVTPDYSKLHLWDGGVYDNLGLEGLHNFREGWREGIDFVIVSDASGKSRPERYWVWKSLMRIITGVMMDQIRSLRSRAVLERMINHKNEDPGGFIQIGNTCSYVLKGAEMEDEIPNKSPQCLTKEEADRAANMKTDIGRLSEERYELLFRHGFEVADYTLYAHNTDKFKYIGYSKSHWG